MNGYPLSRMKKKSGQHRGSRKMVETGLENDVRKSQNFPAGGGIVMVRFLAPSAASAAGRSTAGGGAGFRRMDRGNGIGFNFGSESHSTGESAGGDCET